MIASKVITVASPARVVLPKEALANLNGVIGISSLR